MWGARTGFRLFSGDHGRPGGIGVPWELVTKRIILVFSGPPGSGKGTYGNMIAKRWGILHVSVGDLIRKELTTSRLSQVFKAKVDRGLLVPDSLAAQVCKNHICRIPSKNSWIIDGFPRTLQQAKMLEEFARPHVCVNFRLPTTILMKKLLGRRICMTCGEIFNLANIDDTPYTLPAILPRKDCTQCRGDAQLFRRADDTIETIQQRLATYEKDTRPLLGYYDAEGRLVNFEVIKGIGDILRLESTLISFLQKKYGAASDLCGVG